MNKRIHNLQDTFQTVYGRVKRAHRRYYFQSIVRHTVQYSVMAIFLLLALSLVHVLFQVAQPIRLALTAGVVGWYAIFTLYRVFPALKELLFPSETAVLETARRLGNEYPEIRDALVDFIQLYQDQDTNGSPIIRKLALEQLAARLRGLSLDSRFHRRAMWKKYRVYLWGISVYLILFLAFPAQLGLALKKTILPWKSFQEALPLRIVNESGNLSVLKNETVRLKGKLDGVFPVRLYLLIQDTTSVGGGTDTPKSEKIAIPLPQTPEFEYTLGHVRKSFVYRFAADLAQVRFRHRPVVSLPGRVQVRERPLIRNLQVKLIPPAYSRLPEQVLAPNDGDISALRGSRAELQIESDKQIRFGYVLFGDSQKTALKPLGHTARAEFKIMKNNSYTIHIFDADSIGNDDPVEYHIYPIPDEYPYAEIKQPDGDVDLGNELNVPLFIEMRDDFGFKKLRLIGTLYRQGEGGDSSHFELNLPYRLIEPGKAFSQRLWDLTGFYMVPDDYIRYYAEVWDNDPITGPKRYATAKYTIRLPSLLEIIEKAGEEQKNNLEEIKDIAGNTKELKEKLKEISRELKKETEMNWERKQEIKQQLDKQKKAMEKLRQVQEKLDDVIKNLDQNKMVSPETLEKYFELQKMMEELATPELKKAMEKLQKALETADPRQIQKAMEKLQFSVEQFEKNVKRTYELFKQVMMEQKLDELVNLAEKMNKEQGEINRKLSQPDVSKEDMKHLGSKEQNLEKQGEYLKKEISQTEQDYREMLKQLTEKLAEAGAFMEQQQLQQQMQEMSQQLTRGDMQKAREQGGQIKPNLDQLQSMLQSLKQSMTQQQKEELMQAMQKSVQDMLMASYQEERLAERSQQLNPASSQITHIARQQARLQEATKQIISEMVDISNKTFFLPPQMSQTMSQIMQQMGKAVQNLENRNLRGAARSQKQAMGNLNAAMLAMQGAMNRMAQSNSASGFQEFMQQLQQMAGQQGQLNQQSMNMFQMGQQGKMQLSADALARLAAQQEMIHRSLEQLNGQMGNRRDVLGRLGDVGKEMEDVVKELKANRLNQKVLQRQQRILSRLLDAQRSIREKEYSRKRQAEWEKQVIAKSPPALRKSLLQKEDRLRKELMNSLQEGYTQEYREFIKKYFEHLSRTPLREQE